jgi:hypothetical protein
MTSVNTSPVTILKENKIFSFLDNKFSAEDMS